MPPLICAVLIFMPARAMAYRHDAGLSAKLKAEFEAVISSAPSGRELYGKLAGAGPGYTALRVLARRDPSDWFSWFDPGSNAVYFNSRFILKFFAAKGFDEAGVVDVLWGNKEVREELVKRAAPLYLHELVHALQYYHYPEYRRDAGANPLEFEYEAYLTEDIYVHERMKADPSLLRDFISGTYTDIYTADIFATYFALSLDPGLYREKIRKNYEERRGGYISMEHAESAQKNSVADARIFAYAAGSVGEYAENSAALARLSAQKEEYARFIRDFYETRWPSFSADALLLIGGTALEEKNYPLALDCLAVADENSAGDGLPPGELEALRAKGALAILEAASFMRDNSAKMGLESLSQHLKSLEKACRATGRPFPEDLLGLRDRTYPRAAARYSGLYKSAVSGAKKDYYRENMEYFSAPSGAAQIEK